MDKTWLVLLCVYGLVNLIVFGMYAADKAKAKKGAWRTPEVRLMTAGAIGIIGALLGMVVCHHKTKKPLFAVGLPMIFFVEAALAVVVYLKFIR
ncbi:MAG: DUF1294 domain-containing protein [Ruminococcus sp.]|uniref:DUF1294 domain-containing protein n=1 Tax=Ruminococcus sp. TaxID=41978 RepID=UPI0025F8BD61|nr:DUF1294 domain-containing protein [Ruminococcus sp.]MCR5541332.1 DUF1294 domain-containing protein [Ruminococcus sp.]